MGTMPEKMERAREASDDASGSASNEINVWLRSADVANKNKQSYQEKLEGASPGEVFRYIFLINNAAVEQYVSQSRSQAEASFTLSRRAGIAGFVLVLVAVGVGVGAELLDYSLSVAYLTGIVGVLTQFISGVFFWIYNRTLQQINLFYQGIMSQQTDALAALGRESEAEKMVGHAG